MFDSIDPKKLVEQDPDFKKYLAEACLAIMLYDKGAAPFIASVHSFYSIGMSTQDLVQWVRNMKSFEDHKPDSET